MSRIARVFLRRTAATPDGPLAPKGQGNHIIILGGCQGMNQQFDRHTWRGKAISDQHAAIGEWVYGGLFETEDGCWIVRLAPGEYEAWIIEHIRVDPDTVGQCTGLVDKNGTAIFAGDVLRYHDDEDGFDGPGRLIVWDDGRAAFCTHEIGRGPTCEIIPHRKEQYSSAYFDDCCLSVCDIREDYAVAGNLYDNPELMGVVS